MQLYVTLENLKIYGVLEIHENQFFKTNWKRSSSQIIIVINI